MFIEMNFKFPSERTHSTFLHISAKAKYCKRIKHDLLPLRRFWLSIFINTCLQSSKNSFVLILSISYTKKVIWIGLTFLLKNSLFKLKETTQFRTNFKLKKLFCCFIIPLLVKVKIRFTFLTYPANVLMHGKTLDAWKRIQLKFA